jgi:anti-anti-sigma factor
VIRALEINSKLLWKELSVMERHLTTSTASIDTQAADGLSGIRASRTSTTVNRDTRTRPVREQLSPAFECGSAWEHTLVLTGELTYRSAPMLELAIERLCEEGVTDITLDLRQLADIDSIGVAVISFRCGLCRRQGYGFALIPGSRLIHRAFEQAGVIDLLPFRGDEVAARRLRASIPGRRSRR